MKRPQEAYLDTDLVSSTPIDFDFDLRKNLTITLHLDTHVWPAAGALGEGVVVAVINEITGIS